MDAVAVITVLTLYGNFTTMGVVADCPPGMAPDQVGRVMAYVVEDGSRRQVHDLVQVGATNHFAGSLFWLEPGRQYTVEVEFYDRQGHLAAKGRVTGHTRSEPTLPQTPRELYVAHGGSDDAAGTLEEPLATLKAAFSRLTPGTTVFVRQGTYFEGGLAPVAGGTAEAPIVVRGYNDEKVVIDGADPALISASWDKDGSVYATPFKGGTWNVTALEKATGKCYRLYPLKTKQEIISGRSRYGNRELTLDQLGLTGAYHCDGEKIYVVAPGGDISDYEVYVSKETSAVELDGQNYFRFDGLYFRHYGCGKHARCIGMNNSSENLVQNCRFEYCNTGLWIQRGSFNNTVQDNLFLDDVNHWHFSYTKGESGWNYHGEIETGSVNTGGTYTGRGLVIRRNRIEGLFDGVHLAPWVEVNDVTSETDFLENEVINVADDFIETDGYSRNVRMVGNVMDRSLSGVSLAQALDGPTFVVRNVIANCGVAHAATNPTDYEYEGYPVKTNGGPMADTGSGPVFFYHNTAYTTDPKGRAFLVKTAKWRLFVFRNNIWCGKAMGVDVWHPPLSPVIWDWDDIYSVSGPFLKYGSRVFRTLDEARLGMNVYKHCISDDPMFENGDAGDYMLTAESPCIDAGVVVPGINDGRYQGKAPDIGAFEAE